MQDENAEEKKQMAEWIPSSPGVLKFKAVM